MDQILALATGEVKKMAETIDEPLRRRTIDTLRDLQYMLETPEETMQRLHYTVSIELMPAENDVAAWNKADTDIRI
jgi:hypothetical protein